MDLGAWGLLRGWMEGGSEEHVTRYGVEFPILYFEVFSIWEILDGILGRSVFAHSGRWNREEASCGSRMSRPSMLGIFYILLGKGMWQAEDRIQW